MELLHNLADGFSYIAGVAPLLAISAGVAMGMLIGAMPGLSPSMGVALLVPFTYDMSPALALVMLTSLYLAADFGGAITAVTINTPGTPSSAVTAFDGYPLTRAGKSGMALGVSLVSSTVGGLIGTIILILFSAPLAELALHFFPTEYFALSLLGLTCATTIGGNDRLKALAMVLLGLVLTTIGTDPILGTDRFTFGIRALSDGFTLIPMLIGLFAIGELLVQVQSGEFTQDVWKLDRSEWPKLIDYWRLKGVILGSSLVGTLIGILPGAGSTIASFAAYDLAKRTSKRPEQFGHGSLEGVAASESANSSCVGGALVPMLTLGIPGSASTAVLIGALMIHKVVPGPSLYQKHPEIVYALFASLLAANFIALGLGFLGCRWWAQVTRIPKRILYPLIIVTAVMGSFSVSASLFDVGCCLGFGALGWILRRHGYPVAPIVLGVVLGRLIEVNFRQAVLMGGYAIFFQRWPCVVILTLSAISVVWPLLRAIQSVSSTRSQSE